MKSYLPLLSILLLSVAEAAEDSKFTVGRVVRTSSGPVAGHAATPIADVSVYLGIPYAKPPIGNMRFKSPQKYTGTTPIDRSKY